MAFLLKLAAVAVGAVAVGAATICILAIRETALWLDDVYWQNSDPEERGGGEK